MPLPAAHALRKLGRDLAVARRKRRIATSDMAARLFVSRDTFWRLERGYPTVALGTLATALFVLGLKERPASDELALSLDEHHLPNRIRRPRAGGLKVAAEWQEQTHLADNLTPTTAAPVRRLDSARYRRGHFF